MGGAHHGRNVSPNTFGFSFRLPINPIETKRKKQENTCGSVHRGHGRGGEKIGGLLTEEERGKKTTRGGISLLWDVKKVNAKS